MVVVPPPVELIMVVTVVVVPSGSTLFIVKSELAVGAESSVTVMFSLPFVIVSFIGDTVIITKVVSQILPSQLTTQRVSNPEKLSDGV